MFRVWSIIKRMMATFSKANSIQHSVYKLISPTQLYPTSNISSLNQIHNVNVMFESVFFCSRVCNVIHNSCTVFSIFKWKGQPYSIHSLKLSISSQILHMFSQFRDVCKRVLAVSTFNSTYNPFAFTPWNSCYSC